MTIDHAGRSGGGFRYDIEGLRAVAALLVAVYHIWLGRVSGGVDVFFVIAGFLVTATLLRQLERTGRVRPGLFLGRLLVRLLPNAMVVLAAVLAATLVLLPVTRRADVLREIAASALYVENWQLISASVDYLARDRGDSPVQHFWAMSIQGQFYLIWLALALVAVRLGAAGSARRRFALLVAAVTAGSFVWSATHTYLDQPVAYFHTATRAWEFGTGALVALGVLAVPRLRPGVERLLGWVGLLLVTATGLLLPVASVFPGVAALVPVLGAVLILLSGSPVAGSAARVLSVRPLVSLGGVAYAIYLWHWPLLVFTLHVRGVDRAGLLDGLLVLATSVVLAYASTHLVERPVRNLRWDRRGEWFAPVTGATAALLLVGVTGTVSATTVPRMPVGNEVRLSHWADPASSADFRHPPSDNPYPGFVAASQDEPPMGRDGCHQGLRGAEVIRCVYGDPDAARTMVLVGGSHSVHWQPALHEIGRQTGWRVETMTKSGCRQGLSLVGPEHALYADAPINASCRAWNEEMLAILLSERPDLVVGNTTTVDGGIEVLPPYYREFWRELAGADIAMLGIRGTPRASTNRVDCIAEHGPAAPECQLLRAATLAESNPADELDRELPGLEVVDVNEWLCDDVTCPPVIEDTIVYHDAHHLSATFSRALAQPLFREAAHVLAG